LYKKSSDEFVPVALISSAELRAERSSAMDDDNPYAPPKSDAYIKDLHPAEPSPAWRDGILLVVRKGAELPDRCLRCNAPAEGYRFSRSLSWLNSLWLLTILISPLILIIVYFGLRKRGRVTVGLCTHHQNVRRRATALGLLIVLAGVGLIAAGAARPGLAPGLESAGILLVVLGMIGGMVGSRVLVPRRIDKHFIWLGRVSPEFLAAYPEWRT
jgi:hypothetical protein